MGIPISDHIGCEDEEFNYGNVKTLIENLERSGKGTLLQIDTRQ